MAERIFHGRTPPPIPSAERSTVEVSMSHQIKKMVFTGEVPWHGLGVQLPANASYEEIVEAAGFYTAEERELRVSEPQQPVPDKKALIRGDTGEYLAVVGRAYVVLQFSEIARTLVQAAGGVKAVFHTAGTLGPVGARGWLLGELPNPIAVKGDPSPIRKYLLGSGGHDGSTAVVLKNVATRVVCANTLGVALGEKMGAEWRIHHTANAKTRLEEAGRAFKELARSYDLFGDLANEMAKTRFSDRQMLATVDELMPVPRDDREHTGLLKERDRVLSLFEVGIGLESAIRGTAWAAFQAWTEYLDHHRQQRVTKGQNPQLVRLESVWMGSSATKKQAALTAISAEAGIQLAAA